MRLAINNFELIEQFKKHELIYIFDKEPLQQLLNTNIHCISKKCIKQIEEIDYNLTNYDIPCISKIIKKDNVYEIPKEKNFKFAIIIPNYNYAEWLEKCINSILNQTYKNFEIIFVDDCSSDNSLNIAKKLLKSPNKIIELKQKRLNGGARNEAYLHVSDDVDYIYYVDSDDWLKDEFSLEKINRALFEEPDVLFVGIAKYKNGKMTKSSIPNYKDKYEAINGWSGSCGKVIRKELATRPECLYAEGTLKEDRNQHRRICIYMNNFKCLPIPIYVWNQDNYKSVTTIREEAIWGTSTIRHYADTLQLYLQEKGKDPKIDEILYKRVELARQEMENGGDQQW